MATKSRTVKNAKPKQRRVIIDPAMLPDALTVGAAILTVSCTVRDSINLLIVSTCTKIGLDPKEYGVK